MAIKRDGKSLRDFKFNGRPQARPHVTPADPNGDVGLERVWAKVDASKAKWLESLGL